MLKYLNVYKLEIIILGIWITALNGYRLFFHIIGVDTEQALLSLDTNLNWTLGNGRFASAFLRKVLMPYGFSYDVAMIIILIGWLAVGIAYLHCLKEFGAFRRWTRLFFAAVFISCPLWAEQNYFVCSVFANVIGMLLTIIAAYLLIQVFQKGATSSYVILSVILMVVSIGVYQALLYLLIANCIVFLSLDAYVRNSSFKEYIKAGLKCITVIIVAVILYFMCAKATISLFYNPSIDYAGYRDAASYIPDRINWFESDITQCFSLIKEYIINSIHPFNTYGTPILLVLWCVLQIILLTSFFKNGRNKNLIIFIGNFLLLIDAYLGCLLFGGSVSVREQFAIPLTVAFMGTYLVNELVGIIYAVNDKKCATKWKTTVVALVCIYCVMAWGSKQMLVNSSDYVRFNSDVSYAENIMRQVKQLGDYSSKKIVFIGQNRWVLPDNYYKGEVIGNSMFIWDAGGPVGVNYRAYAFLQDLGYKYNKPTIAEVQEVKRFNESYDIFGDQEHITIWKDFIVVNLDKF